MKKLFTTLAILGTSIYASQAQKTIDLSIDFQTPTEGATYTNVPVGSNFDFELMITNNGPDAITETDTLLIYVLGHAKGSSGEYYYIDYPVAGSSIAAGESGTITLSIENGFNLGTTADGDVVDYYFPQNATHVANSPDIAEPFSYYTDIIGFDVDGTLFTDEGIETDVEGNTVWGGNNVKIISGVVFGDNSSILNYSNATNINVYPNPTKGSLNFSYDFEKASAVTANVYDVTGRMVATQDFGTQNAGTQVFTLNVANLPNGNYSLELNTQNNKGVSKFVISK